jgi:hypothetical protein
MKVAKIIILVALMVALAAILYWQFRTLQQRTVIEVIHREVVTTNTSPNSATGSARRESEPATEEHRRNTIEQSSVQETGATTGKEEVRLVSPPSAPTPNPTARATPAIQYANGAAVTGKVSFRGTPPRRPKIMFDADPRCAEMHAEPVLTEDVIVNEDGTLRNVFVYVKQGLEGATFPSPSEPVVIEQQGCLYHPHVFGMQTRQPLVIRNSDDTLHNIHALPKLNKEFNIGQPSKGMETRRTFAAAEVMIHFKCDMHPWMSAYVGVLDHPYFVVTGEGGTFALPPLPPGDYVIAAWHEQYGELTQAVTVTGTEAQVINFTFGP